MRDRQYKAMMLLLFGACLLAWSSVLGALLAWAPTIEAKLLPPITDLVNSNVVRNGRSVCWHTSLRKTRNMVMTRSSSWVDYGNGTRDMVNVTLDGVLMPTGAVIEAGARVTLGPFCAELPLENSHVTVDISPDESKFIMLRIYRSFWWDVVITAPPVIIPKQPVLHYDWAAHDHTKPPCISCHHKR